MNPANGGPPIRLDQVVHGYDRGHRLIRSSRSLDESSGQLMRAMSDLLTPRLLADGESYLVGYPLKGSTAYVLARTWAALEMPRPGSVWTHSLILDYQALTTMEDPGVVTALLRQPRLATVDEYASPLGFTPPSPSEGRTTQPDMHPSARTALGLIYAAQPAQRVFVTSASRAEDEALALALWRQAWPALRRNLTFVTAVDPKLPSSNAACVIAFGNSSGMEAEIRSPDAEQALDHLIRDLPLRRQTELRSFIARHAFDALQPRAAVLTLVNLWAQLGDATADDLAQAIDDARRHTSSPRLTRDVIDRLLAPSITAAALTDFVGRFGSLDPGGPVRALETIEYATLEGDLSQAISRGARCPPGTVGAQVFARLSSELPVARLVDASLDDEAVLRLAAARPQLLSERRFWPHADPARAEMAEIAASAHIPIDAVVTIVGGDPGPKVLQALAGCWPEEAPRVILRMIEMSGQHEVVTFLGQSPSIVARAVADGAKLKPAAAERVISAALTAGGVSRPPESYWTTLAGPDPDVSHAPNLATLVLCGELVRGDGSTTAVYRSFTVVEAALRRGALSRTSERYVEASLKDARITSWPLSDGVLEAAVRLFVSRTSGREQMIEAISSKRQFQALLNVAYYRLGLPAVQDIARTAELHLGGDDWRSDLSWQFLKSKEKGGWFW